MADTTLLDVVQSVMSDMNSDEVNSIGDTIESLQIANLVKQTYLAIQDELDLQASYELTQLTGLSDPTRPCVMQIPSNLHSIKFIKYNIKKGAESEQYRTCLFYEPDKFLDHVQTFRTTDANVGVQLIQNDVEVPYKKDEMPYIWTTFDGKLAVFDSVDLTEESTLTEDRSLIYAQRQPEFPMEDETIIDLPYRFMGLLKNEVRKLAFDLYKGGVPLSVAESASRSRVRSQRIKYVDRMNREQVNRPDYGRKRR